MALALAEPRGESVLAGLRYWEQQRRGKPLPSRLDIDPHDIAPLLPQVYLVNVAYDPLDFQYRLLGTEIVDHSVADYTGRRLRDLPEQRPPSQIWALYKEAVEGRRPVCTRVPYLHIPGRSVEMLATPLSSDGQRVDMLFGVIEFEVDRLEPARAIAFRQHPPAC